MVHSRPQANFGGVDLASGTYRGLNSLDLKMRGRGPDLSFSHYYNSFGFNRIPMGMGWNHNLCAYITEGIDDSVIVHWGNGTISRFELDSGIYIDKSGNHDQLESVDDLNYGYNLKRKNQTIYKFRRFRAYPFIDLDSEDLEVIVLLIVEDWAGNTLTFDYQSETTVSDSFGRSLVMSYNNTTRQLIQVTEKVSGVAERSISFTYNDDDLLTTYIDAEGGITRYTYFDEPTTLRHKLLKEITYPKGNMVEIDYDQATGQVNSIKDATGSEPSEINYTPTTGLTTVTDPENRIFQYNHDGEGRLAQFKGNSDVDWNVIERTDTNSPNLPTRLEDQEGRNISFEYDDNGNLTKTTNARGWIADYTYNSKNRLTSSTSFHDPTVTSPPKTSFSYDTDDNRLRSINAPEQGQVDLFYDSVHLDELIEVEDGRNFSTHFGYDIYGNLDEVEDAEGNSTTYTNDYAGRTLSVVDAEGIKTTYTYNKNDRPEDISNYLRDGLTILRTVERNYDANSNLDDVRWNNSGTSSLTDYSYDSRDRLASVTTPAGFSKLFTYYDNDLPHTITDCNNVTATLVYDDHNRLQEKNFSDSSQNVDYEYFSNGKLKQVYKGNNPSLKTAFTYNNLNLVESVSDRYGKTVTYTYDNGGRLTDIHYPGNFDVSYTYDTADRLKTVSAEGSLLATYYYDAAGNLEKIDRTNNVDSWYSYDDASRLTGLTEKTASGSTLWSYTYGLDHVGNHTSLTVSNAPYEFIPDEEDISYTNNKATNRLLSAGSTSYTYDNNGNRETSLTNGITTTYSWDYENRLTSISNLNLSFTYDALGNRIARSDGGQTTRYVLNLIGNMSRVLAETDASGNEIAYYVYGLGLLARIDAVNAARRFYHFNHRGDTVALTDNTGQITERYGYDEYGRVQESDGNIINQPFKFIGRYGVMDEGHGLHFMRARYYDAHVGRFLSEDPIGFEGGDWNLFAYATSNPVNFVDPSGLNIAPIYGNYGGDHWTGGKENGGFDVLPVDCMDELFMKHDEAYVNRDIYARLSADIDLVSGLESIDINNLLEETPYDYEFALNYRWQAIDLFKAKIEATKIWLETREQLKSSLKPWSFLNPFPLITGIFKPSPAGEPSSSW